MNENTLIIERFYTAFKQKDYRVMQDCYHDEAIFFDPVFEDLNSAEVRAMWEMLCKASNDFFLEYNNVHTDGEYGGCNWTAGFIFPPSGKKVRNDVRAYFRFKDNKIIEHTDNFDTWKWSRQALGWSGWLLGWSNALQQKIRNRAQDNLAKFMVADQRECLLNDTQNQLEC